MDFYSAVVNMVPGLSADLSPKDRADVTKIAVIVMGAYALSAYIADKYFEYLNGKSVGDQSSTVDAIDTVTTMVLE